MTDFPRILLALAIAWPMASASAQTAQSPAAARSVRGGDAIAVVVNRELVTLGEVSRRTELARANAARNNVRLPDDVTLRREVLDSLIDERVLLTHARDSGQRVEESELERAIANVAAQNQLTHAQMLERLRRDGIDFSGFRANLRDQLLIERVREREVQARIKISDAEIDALVDKQRSAAKGAAELNLAQILVAVPESAGEAEVAERKVRAEQALARVKAGEDFKLVARELSEDPNRQSGGEIGMRPVDRLPDLFVEAVREVPVGGVVAAPLRSGAGFHVLKVVARKEASAFNVTQTRVRHILLRPSAQLSQEAATARLGDFKRMIDNSTRTFESLAREFSEDGSGPTGGDLGWMAPGNLVPEFEQAMNALPLGGVSGPVVSRFGVHLIQVVDRRSVALDPKQLREQARNVLREQKFDDAYDEWVRDLRARAYIEMRDAAP